MLLINARVFYEIHKQHKSVANTGYLISKVNVNRQQRFYFVFAQALICANRWLVGLLFPCYLNYETPRTLNTQAQVHQRQVRERKIFIQFFLTTCYFFFDDALYNILPFLSNECAEIFFT